jgi:eukaryotic-like serine/threonine-protein kinase
MSLSPVELAALSRLLDQAMELGEPEREAWFATLSEADQPLVPTLREMLAEQSGPSRPDFMHTVPKLGDEGSANEEVASAGELIGPYRLVREIGRGGMGSVWLADREDGTLQRQVALKLPRLAWGAGLAARMKRERNIGALLEHPHIARLYDAGVDPHGRPYLAFEYIAGQAIDTYCESHALTLPQRLRLFMQVGQAVAYAHGHLIVHRDLKPSNVLVTEDGQAHLLDFGIAKLLHEAGTDETQLTIEQGRVLTPQFASPEQVRGEAITVVSDVYALGVLLYQLLTGSLPYTPKRKTLGAIEEAILEGEPPPASSRVSDKAKGKVLRREVDAILAKALRRETGQRYQTAEAFVADLERHLSGERVLAQPDSTWYRLSKTLRRYRRGFAAAGVTMLAVSIGIGTTLWQARKAQLEAERARVVKEFVVDVFKVNSRGAPVGAELRQLPAELLLEHGAQLIETKFQGQPRLQVELYGIVSGIFAEMGATSLTVRYAARHVEVLKAMGAGRTQEGDATLFLGQALFKQNKFEEAKRLAQQVSDLSPSHSELHAKALILLANALRRLGNLDESKRALDIVEQELRASTAPSVTRAQAKRVRALVLAMQNSADEAILLYRSGIEEALVAEGPLSLAVADIRLSFAWLLMTLHRVEESREQFDAAIETLRRFGGVSDIRAASEESEFTLYQFVNDLIPFDQARTRMERVQATIGQRSALVPDSIKAAIDFDLGRAYLWWGNAKSADDLIASSAAILRRSDPSPESIQKLAYAQGAVARYLGRHDEADRFLRERLEADKLAGWGNHPSIASDYADIARNLAMQQRFDEAEAVLESAPKVEPVKGASLGVFTTTAAVVRNLARVKYERGDPRAGLALLPEDEAGAEGWVGWQNQVRGEILCGVGRRTEGLDLIEKALKTFVGNYEHDANWARLRAVAGLCALDNGQRERAAIFARLARVSLDVNSAVSPYYTRALVELEQRLTN